MTSLTLITALALGAPALKDKEPLGTGPGFIGIMFQADGGNGLVIIEVIPDSPATKANLKPNDTILKVDGISMADGDTSAFLKIVASKRPGTILALDIRRGNESLVLKVKLGPRPANYSPTLEPRPPIIDE
ncbi:MAG: PDZ domain-containing protein [Gemmataceae bacterium]|nr:PDZ domain-containing protein [Gemmataceae bacterium]